MSRFRFGPNVINGTITAPTRPTSPPPVEPSPELLDVNITVLDVKTSEWPVAVVFAPEAYDPAKYRRLKMVHFVAVPAHLDRPADPSAAVESDRYVIHSANVADVLDGSPLEIALPDLADDARYNILTVLED